MWRQNESYEKSLSLVICCIWFQQHWDVRKQRDSAGLEGPKSITIQHTGNRDSRGFPVTASRSKETGKACLDLSIIKGSELIFMLCHSHLLCLCGIIFNDSIKYVSKVCSEIPLHHSVFLLERMCCMTTVKWYPVLSVIIYLHKQPLMLGSLWGVGLWVIQFIQALGRS